MIQLSYPYADSIITVKTPDHERALEAYELAKAVSVCHKKVSPLPCRQEYMPHALFRKRASGDARTWNRM
mgnify:CR=1 FL=1